MAAKKAKTKPAAKAKPAPKAKADAQHPMRQTTPHAQRNGSNGGLLCKALENTCGGYAVKGREVCRMHGGASPLSGPSHPTYKHGRRSRFIPARLAEKYGEAMADADLMEYRADIALLESRLAELLGAGESELLWKHTQDAFSNYHSNTLRARRAPEGSTERANAYAAAGAALETLGKLIDRGTADVMRWTDIYRVVEQMGRAKEREHKRLIQMEQMITVEQLLAVLGQIADAARSTFSNPVEVETFAAALSQYGVVALQPIDSGH